MSDLLVDDEAQKLYLSSMLGNPALFARVQHIVKASYFDAQFQEAVGFMKSFYQEHRGVPSLPVFQAATKLKLEATQLPDQDQRFVAEQLAGFCQIRAITEAVLRAPAFIEKGNYGQMVNEIKLATQIQLHTDLGIDYFADPVSRLNESEATEVLIPTGWDSVDELIGGGISRQELVLFTAPSGGGKSIGMLNLGYNLLRRGLNGVYVTLEMREGVASKRLDTMISRITSKNLYANKLKVGQEVEAARDAGCGRFFIKRMREGTTTADHIISYLRELEAVHGFKPDFVIVDYIDIMASVQKHDGSNMFTKDKFVTEEVRAIGFDFNCLMISASQLGRTAVRDIREDKQLGQDHVQGGMSKINTSDLVIAMVKTEAMDASGEYRFEFLKSRNSKAVNKHLVMRWDADTLLITDATGTSTLVLNKKTKPKERTVLKMSDMTPGQAQAGLAALTAGVAGLELD